MIGWNFNNLIVLLTCQLPIPSSTLGEMDPWPPIYVHVAVILNLKLGTVFFFFLNGLLHGMGN